MKHVLLAMLLMLFAGILFSGCAVTHTNDRFEASSVPAGIWHFRASSPNFEISYSVDPWTGMEKLTEGFVNFWSKFVGPSSPAAATIPAAGADPDN